MVYNDKRFKEREGIIKTTGHIIITYTLIGIILPVIIKVVVFENTIPSLLSNEGWAGFLGSYIGGVLGGLGTLIAMYITVKESKEERKKLEAQHAADALQHQHELMAEQNIRRKEVEYQLRTAFADLIADQIGKYITHISKYYFSAIQAESLDIAAKAAFDSCYHKKQELKAVDEEMVQAKCGAPPRSIPEIEADKEQIERELSELQRKYERTLQVQKDNTIFGNRLVANEAYFVMKTKLRGIKEAGNLVSFLEDFHSDASIPDDPTGVRLNEQSDELMSKFSVFRNQYVQ